MSNIPTLVIVGADKGGVGKTTVARILLDYLKFSGVEYRAFDSETPAGVLARFFPADTEVVDMEHTVGQSKVLDGLQRSRVTVLDVAARQLTKTLNLLGEIGMMDSVREKKLRLVVIHVLSSSVASFAEIQGTATAIEGAEYVLATNHINDAAYFGWDTEEAQRALGLARFVISVPKLDETTYETVDRESLSFGDFKDDPKFGVVVRGKVRSWLNTNFKSLAPLGLIEA